MIIMVYAMEKFEQDTEGHLDGDELARVVRTVYKNSRFLASLLELEELYVSTLVRRLAELPSLKPIWELFDELLHQIFRL